MITFSRHTVSKPVRFEGKGLHTGDPVSVTVHPGEAGIAFRTAQGRVEARPENVTDTTRSTRVGDVGTVEHLMSALAGLEVTDAEIEVEGGEIPGADGSAIVFLQALEAAGLVELGTAEMPSLFSRLFLQEDEIKIAVAKGHGSWRFAYDVSPRWPGRQEFESEDVLADYRSQIAAARTFALQEEVPFIISQGLGRGLDENSAVVLGIEGYKNEPRFPDEPARHKLLDAIGDLYLAGIPIGALSVVAERSGHRTHVKMAAMMRDALTRGSA